MKFCTEEKEAEIPESPEIPIKIQKTPQVAALKTLVESNLFFFKYFFKKILDWT
jgi:hypothetical protein